MVSEAAVVLVRLKLKLHRLKPDGIKRSGWSFVRLNLKLHRLKPDVADAHSSPPHTLERFWETHSYSRTQRISNLKLQFQKKQTQVRSLSLIFGILKQDVSLNTLIGTVSTNGKELTGLRKLLPDA